MRIPKIVLSDEARIYAANRKIEYYPIEGKLRRALGKIKSHAKEYFEMMCEDINKIVIIRDATSYAHVYKSDDVDIIYIDIGFLSEADEDEIAQVIIHEYMHTTMPEFVPVTQDEEALSFYTEECFRGKLQGKEVGRAVNKNRRKEIGRYVKSKYKELPRIM